MSARFIHEFLLSHAETRATLPAVVSDARVVTHRGLRDEADALAVQLRRVGIKPGQTIVVMSEPTIETVALVCACSIVERSTSQWTPLPPGSACVGFSAT